MKISAAVRNAWKTYTASFGDTLRFLLVEACLLMICLAPLLLLSDPSLAFGALLSVPLGLLILLPARINAAEGMAHGLEGGKLCTRRLISTRRYGEKLVCGLKRVFFLALWAAPLTGLLLAARHHFSGEVDSFTVLRMIKNDLGGGDQMTGIWRLVLILVAAVLVLFAGFAFHSGARHAFAQGKKDLIRGHHGKVMLVWLCSLLSLLPAILGIVWAGLRYLPAVGNLNGLLMGTVSLPSTRETLIILGAGAILTLPLLPLKSLIPAAYVDGLKA